MIDYISISLPIQSAKPYFENKFIRWTANTDLDTGEVNKYIGKIKKLHLNLFDGENPKIELRNSIHEFYHDANYTDFTIQDLTSVLQVFKNNLGIDPEKAEIHAFEFGVNIETDVLPPEVFKHYLSHKSKEFIPMPKKYFRNSNSSAKGIVCEHSQVSIKVYDKGSQYNLDRLLMRFEIKITKMQAIQKKEIPIFYLSDLLNSDILEKLGNTLLAYHDEILKSTVFDNEKVKSLKRTDFDLFKLGQSPSYWTELKENCGIRNTTTWKRRKIRFTELIKQVETLDIHGKIRSQILDKWNALTQKHIIQNVPKFTTFDNVPSESNPTPKNAKLCLNLPLVLSVNLHTIQQPSEAEKNRIEKRQCLTCGLDISHKRIDALTCSKRCRNEKSNQVHDHLKKVRKDSKSLNLFDSSVFVDLEVLKAKSLKRRN